MSAAARWEASRAHWNPQLGQFCKDPVRITFIEEARTKGAFPEREKGGKTPQQDLLGKGGRP